MELDCILVRSLNIEEDQNHSQNASIKHINIRPKIGGQLVKTGAITVTQQPQRPSLPCLIDLSGGGHQNCEQSTSLSR